MMNANVKTLMDKAADMCNVKYASAKAWHEIECFDIEKKEMHEWSDAINFCAELFDMDIKEWINYTCFKDNPEF